jgi:hypothetical protein
MITILRETHTPPENVIHRLRSAGGANRYNEPNYRVIWGWNRLAWIGGKFEDRDDDGNLLREVVELRQEPKYPQLNRWHIERWLPAESYGSPKSWYAQTIERLAGQSIPALGPYPERGDYEHCFTLESHDGKFLQLTPTVVEQVARAIEWSRNFSKSQRHESLYEREARQEKSYDAWAFDLLSQNVPVIKP